MFCLFQVVHRGANVVISMTELDIGTKREIEKIKKELDHTFFSTNLFMVARIS
jgi:hypothetical protein